VSLERARDAEPRVALGGLVEQWRVETVHVVDVLTLPGDQLRHGRGKGFRTYSHLIESWDEAHSSHTQQER
jgi:hypothetical protein